MWWTVAGDSSRPLGSSTQPLARTVAGETVLHEGPATVRANGWVELPSGRLLSPATVHHIDTHPNAS